MTVPAQDTRVTYTASGSSDIFAYPFRILSSADLLVYVDDDLQVLTTDYTVTGVDEEDGGNVVFTADPAADSQVVILRNMDYGRTDFDYQNSGSFRADTVNRDFDALAMQIQQIAEKINRAPLLSVATVLAGLAFPSPGAGQYIRWNNAGTALETAASVVDSGTFLQSGTGAVEREANAKMAETAVSVTDFDGIGDGTTDVSSNILAAVASLRRNAVSILDTIGGNTITAYTSGELYFPPGVYLVPPDVLNFTQDLGLTLRGAGSRGKSNFYRGATTLLVSGTSSGYGIRAYRNGARNLKIMDMDICYATSGFTGSLIDVLDAPGLHLIRCYVGTYGITAGTRLQTAASLIRSTYDEFMTFDSCVFDGAVRGWWSDDTRTELANTFGGSVTNFNDCTFYDFSENPIYHGGTRTRQTLNLNGTVFNPISVSPSSSCINIDNVEGLNLRGVAFAPSTTCAPASQWLRATNCTGTIDGCTFDDLAPAGLLSGKLSVNGNRIYCTSGFTLNNGIITGRSNEFSKGASGWILSPTAPLCVDLGPDEFKTNVTNSYYIASDSADLSGRVRYCHDLDASAAKFTNVSSRVFIENDDNKDISVSASTYAISIRDTGRTIVATGSGAQTFTLPTPVAGTRLYIFKSVAQDLTIDCAAGTNFFAGAGAVKSSVDSSSADVGGFIELEAYATVGWKVASLSGTWVFS